MSTPTSEHHSVEIRHTQEDHEGKKNTGSDPNPDNPPRESTLNKSNSVTSQMTKWKNRLQNCLQDTGKSIERAEEDPKEKTEEGEAYKKLMEDLEREPKENPISVIMTIVNVILFVVFIILVTTFASIHVIHTKWLLNLRIHSWVALLMVAVSGYPFIRFITYLISEPVVWVWKMNKYVFFFARKLKKSVDVTLWFTLILWVWYTWFRPRIDKDTRGASTLHVPVKEYKEVVRIAVKQITRLLMALTIGAFIWTVKSAVFLKLLADLHYKELCDRIRQTILDFHGIQFIEKKSWDFLTKPAKNGTNKGVGKGSGEIANAGNNNIGHGKKDDEMSFWMCVSKLKKQTAPIWILRRLTYAYTEHMRKSKPAILHRLENVDDDEKLMEEAKNMLKKVVGSHKLDDITREDLHKYGLKDKEINYVLKLFTSKVDGKQRDVITQDEFLRWAVLAVKNCLGLERIIESSKHVFFKLDVLMSSGVVVITLVIWLLLSELVNTGQIAILFAPFLSASFIFGESLKNSFDGLIFVFGMHPFDVGDRVIIENVEMKVNEINIMTTIFIKYDTGVEEYYPNSVLATKVISNLDITPDQPDSIEFTVPVETPQELIGDMQVKIKKILDDNLTFTSDTVVSKQSISDKDVTLKVYFKYLVSYLSAETKAQHRSKILSKIMKLREQLKNETTRKKDMDPSREEASILRFQIDVQVKLPEIEELKNKIITTLHGYNPSLKDCSQVLFTKINKEKITMDVRMRHPKDLFKTDDEKNKLKEQIEQAIEKPNQRKEKKVEVSWLPKPDLDDDS